MSPAASPAVDRFWAKVRLDLNTGCWEWTASKTKGYGYLASGGRNKTVRAHRFSYELLVGPIPDGLVIDHLCRNRACVNPGHLEPVTSGENTRRSPLHNQHEKSKTHCAGGHLYSEENTRIDARGRRFCRACAREGTRKYRERRASA